MPDMSSITEHNTPYIILECSRVTDIKSIPILVIFYNNRDGIFELVYQFSNSKAFSTAALSQGTLPSKNCPVVLPLIL
jgi:hypothetical protein